MTRRRVHAAAVAALLVAGLVGSGLHAGLPGSGTATPTPAGETGPLAGLHEQGVDGEGVDVGVVDVTGYATGHPDLAGRVEATAAFGADGTGAAGRYTHGTAAAATVAAVAPRADLHLATVTRPAEFRRAVRWLVSQGVDVVVAPVTFYGQPDDGTSGVARAAARASERGVTFVAPAGNLGRRHRQGRDVGEGRTVRFGDDGRTRVRGDGGRFVAWLSWDRAHAGANYTAVLYREDGDGPRAVARSRPYAGDAVPNERLTATLDPDGRYAVVVRGPDGATGARVELESPTHRLANGTPRGSLAAPATASDVLVVGAYADRSGEVPGYTARGPTDDGRPGLDVVAPSRPVAGVEGERHAGTSLAAPYVAGVAALLLSADATLGPDRVEQVLELTATDVGPRGYDLASGFGRVDARRAARRVGAVERAANRTTEARSIAI